MVTVFSSDTRGLENKIITGVLIMGKRWVCFIKTGFGVSDYFLGTEHSMVFVFSLDTRGLENKIILKGSIMGTCAMRPYLVRVCQCHKICEKC